MGVENLIEYLEQFKGKNYKVEVDIDYMYRCINEEEIDVDHETKKIYL